MIKLYQHNQVIILGNPEYKNNFNIVKKNWMLIPLEYININDPFDKKYRGFYSFRSDTISTLSTITDFWIKTEKMGLRYGT